MTEQQRPLPSASMKIEPRAAMAVDLQQSLRDFRVEWGTLCSRESSGTVQSLSHVRLYNPIDCSSPGLLVQHQLPELTQTHIHWVGDAIQPPLPGVPLLFLTSVFPSIRFFSNELDLHIRWLKYWNFSFSISPSNAYSGLISFRMDWLDLLAVQGIKSTTDEIGRASCRERV